MPNDNTQRLIACSYCGRITSGKASKRCCDNNCAVKLHYARQHSFSTPYEKYLKTINIANKQEPENILPSIQQTNNEHNMSTGLLEKAKIKLDEINQLIK